MLQNVVAVEHCAVAAAAKVIPQKSHNKKHPDSSPPKKTTTTTTITTTAAEPAATTSGTQQPAASTESCGQEIMKVLMSKLPTWLVAKDDQQELQGIDYQAAASFFSDNRANTRKQTAVVNKDRVMLAMLDVIQQEGCSCDCKQCIFAKANGMTTTAFADRKTARRCPSETCSLCLLMNERFSLLALSGGQTQMQLQFKLAPLLLAIREREELQESDAGKIQTMVNNGFRIGRTRYYQLVATAGVMAIAPGLQHVNPAGHNREFWAILSKIGGIINRQCTQTGKQMTYISWRIQLAIAMTTTGSGSHWPDWVKALAPADSQSLETELRSKRGAITERHIEWLKQASIL